MIGIGIPRLLKTLCILGRIRPFAMCLSERAVPNERCRTNGAERTGTNGDTHEQTVPKCADKPNGNVCAVRDPDSSHQDLPRYEQKSHMRKTS